MFGESSKTETFTPILINTEYSYYMYIVIKTQIEGWTTELLHSDCLQLRVHCPGLQMWFFCEHFRNCVTRTGNSTDRYFCSKNVAQIYPIINTVRLLISWNLNPTWFESIDIFWVGMPACNSNIHSNACICFFSPLMTFLPLSPMTSTQVLIGLGLYLVP